MKDFFKNLSLCIREFVFPDTCLICNQAYDSSSMKNKFVCFKCWNKLKTAAHSDEIKNSIISNYSGDNLNIYQCFALFTSDSDSNFINIIHSLKYQGFYSIGYVFGKYLAKKVMNETDVSYDYIFPVPIHHARRRERSYNQSEYIGKGVAEVLNIKLENTILKRKNYTLTQTKLSANERKKNVDKVFEIDHQKTELIRNKIILLVDDVLTTGSTMNSCATILLENGAKRVDVAALMKA